MTATLIVAILTILVVTVRRVKGSFRGGGYIRLWMSWCMQSRPSFMYPTWKAVLSHMGPLEQRLLRTAYTKPLGEGPIPQ